MDNVIPTDNLSNKQKDYATFLPAMSSFFARDLGKEKHEKDYILSFDTCRKLFLFFEG